MAPKNQRIGHKAIESRVHQTYTPSRVYLFLDPLKHNQINLCN